MPELTTAIARVIAMESGAVLRVIPGVLYDRTDAALNTVAEALMKRVEGTGIELLCLSRQGASLIAMVDDSQADLPLTQSDFALVVRQLSYERLGQVWTGQAQFITSDQVPADLVLVA